jgi:hypothetical protein
MSRSPEKGVGSGHATIRGPFGGAELLQVMSSRAARYDCPAVKASRILIDLAAPSRSSRNT